MVYMFIKTIRIMDLTNFLALIFGIVVDALVLMREYPKEIDKAKRSGVYLKTAWNDVNDVNDARRRFFSN